MIKNKLKIGLVFALVMMFGVTSFVGASSLTYSADQIIDLTTSDFTIVSGSTADEVVINADTIEVTMAAGDTFEITNSAREITVSGSNTGVHVSNTCSGTTGTVVITATSAGATAYTIGSAASQCSTSSGGSTGGSTSDTTPPTSTSISIADGAETAGTVSVDLTLAAVGASYMMIANDADFTDMSWETYATSKEWTLTAGDAEKTVYAKFKDSSNNVSTAVSDTITLTGTGETEEEVVEEEATEEETGETTTPTDAITPYSEVIDGDIIQCKTSSNPFAVYIVKVVGDTKYIRHIVSLEIFDYYTHLKWENLKQVDSLTNYSLSGWVRVNTGPDGTPGPADKVYEINGDQSKHWINMTAEDFLTHGGSDAAIYSVNQGELNLYTTGPDVMSL